MCRSIAGVEQDWSGDPLTDRLVDGAADRRRQRQDSLAAVAEDAEHAVAGLLAEVGVVQTGGLEEIRRPSRPSRPSRQTSARLTARGDELAC
jgi:hypothetical protein